MAVDLARINKLHFGLLGASGGLAYATHLGEPASLLLGGAVMGTNFWLMRVIANFVRSAIADPERKGSAALAVGAFILKFGLFLALIAVLFWRLPIEGMSFAFGATLLLLACVVEAVRNGNRLVEGVE
ncbi:MAG TPA: ATP synthase subunit I [Candidatus Acidoferrales bacterium]|nr:ATP synthase subunit I [Candidatus Acidoferrales bacterium]